MCILTERAQLLQQWSVKGKPILAMPSLNSYLMMLHDTRVASHAELWPHSSSDMKQQCPKISINSKLILRFNPCLHTGSVLSLGALRGGFLLLRLSHSWATCSPQSPKSFSFVIYPVWDRSCPGSLPPKGSSEGVSPMRMQANSTSHGRTLKSSCCQPPWVAKQWKQSVIFA